MRSMCDRMSCRGPDGSGVWTADDGRIVLGHRRLSIIDLSPNGAQPMVDPNLSLAIAFNGEIYNYRELKDALQRKGHTFRSESDTEVLLRMYAEYGADMVRHLRGMFAFALWDGRKHGLLLARDHFGIKPLYIAETATGVRAASEVKALLELGDVDVTPSAPGHVGFFLWGHVPEPYTLYRGIRSLPAGSTLWIDRDGTRQITRYASLSELFMPTGEADGQLTQSARREELRAAILESVRYHLVADVDVGVFLSSGLDSATLTALASELQGRLRTVTLGFEEYRGTPNDETPLAEAIARQYGTSHTTVWVRRQEFEQEFDRLVRRMDQPSIDGINTYFVAKAAAESGLKVALSGLGGDELFGGYPSFRQIPRLVALVGKIPSANTVGRILRQIAEPVVGRVTSPKYSSLIEYGGDVAGAYLLRRGLFLPWELEQKLDPELLRAGLEELQLLNQLRSSTNSIVTPRQQISALEASWYMRNQLLRDTDWASMSHSLEVRVPLVDWELWRRVAQLSRSGGSVDKQMMASTPRLPLPTSVLNRPKTGFQIPTRDWMASRASTSRGLRGWAEYVYEAAA